MATNKGYKNFCLADDIASMCHYYHNNGTPRRPDGPECEFNRLKGQRCPDFFEAGMCQNDNAIDDARKK